MADVVMQPFGMKTWVKQHPSADLGGSSNYSNENC